MATAKEALKGMLLDVNDDTDVTFMVHGTEVKAHKCVLNARSVVLKAIVAKPPINGKYLIDDPKVTPEVFQEFIKFLYLDECDIDFGNLDSMLHMSEIYEVYSLKESCIAFSRASCGNIAGVIQCGEVAIRHENYCPELIRCVFAAFTHYFSNNLSYTNDTGSTILASKELVGKIAKECPRIHRFHDYLLLFEVFEWGKKKCNAEKGVIDAEHLKTNLFGIIDKINLEKVPDRDFIDIVQKNGLLPHDQCIQHLVNRLEERIKYDDFMRRIRRRN